MQREYKKVCVVGLGYIGLPTASLLATKGFEVFGADLNSKLVETVQKGEVPIYEPDLDFLVKSAVRSGKLTVGVEPKAADVFILAVPTPFLENHAADLSYVEAATRSIAKFIKPGNLIILESTVPVGTTEKIAKWIQESRSDLQEPEVGPETNGNKKQKTYFLAHCPERVLPGQILKELVDNARIVGGINSESTQAAEDFYAQFVSGKILTTNARTAELAKLTENSFRDVNIAFANELSMICDYLHINVWELISLTNHHPRVKILQPGPGVGGHCIAVDPWFIVSSAPQQAKLIRSAREVNDSKPHYVVKKITEAAKRFKNPVIAVLGLSYKANIDDLRESPAIEITKELAHKTDAKILVVEPNVHKLPDSLNEFHRKMELVELSRALSESDLICLLVDHDEFKKVDRKLLLEKSVIDTRGIWR